MYITMQNLIYRPIGHTIVQILHFFNLQDGAPIIIDFKILILVTCRVGKANALYRTEA